MHLAKNQMYHERVKHIDIKYHIIREIISQRAIVETKIDTCPKQYNRYVDKVIYNS